MTAGILSYQLCDRSFDCDHCPLDAAMRMHFESRHNASEKPMQSPASGSVRYSRNHCWVATMTPEVFRVGIVPMFASLVSPKEIILPRPGDTVSGNQYCWWLVMEGGTLSFTSPVSGKITAVNCALTGDPGKIQHSSLPQEWLFEVTGKSESSYDVLMDKDESQKIYALEHLHFTKLIQDALTKHNSAVGPSFPDGGEMLVENLAMLGPEKYFEILASVFTEKVAHTR
jgi:glycine cleavage system H lipoate-binding protein